MTAYFKAGMFRGMRHSRIYIPVDRSRLRPDVLPTSPPKKKACPRPTILESRMSKAGMCRVFSAKGSEGYVTHPDSGGGSLPLDRDRVLDSAPADWNPQRIGRVLVGYRSGAL